MSERMPHEVASIEDLRSVIGVNGTAPHGGPKLRSVRDFMHIKTHRPEMLVESLLPLPGVIRMEAPQKTGKTPLSLEIAMCVATGNPVFDFYAVLKPGAVIYIEKDDPGGVGAIQQIIEKTVLPILDAPFFPVAGDDAKDLTFGPEFLAWLDHEMATRRVRLVVLDSYTALRSERQGRDIVKLESADVTALDTLAKKHGATILLLHHHSKGSAGLDWSEQGGGTFGMGQASEGQISILRFPESDSNACERLVRVRGRHLPSTDMVLRLQPETMTFEHVMEGPGAQHYPEILLLQKLFGSAAFTPKAMQTETGISRAHSHRLLAKLVSANVLAKTYGEYRLRISL